MQESGLHLWLINSDTHPSLRKVTRSKRCKLFCEFQRHAITKVDVREAARKSQASRGGVKNANRRVEAQIHTQLLHLEQDLDGNTRVVNDNLFT